MPNSNDDFVEVRGLEVVDVYGVHVFVSRET